MKYDINADFCHKHINKTNEINLKKDAKCQKIMKEKRNSITLLPVLYIPESDELL